MYNLEVPPREPDLPKHINPNLDSDLALAIYGAAVHLIWWAADLIDLTAEAAESVDPLTTELPLLREQLRTEAASLANLVQMCWGREMGDIYSHIPAQSPLEGVSSASMEFVLPVAWYLRHH